VRLWNIYGVITNDASNYINLSVRIAHIICNHSSYFHQVSVNVFPFRVIAFWFYTRIAWPSKLCLETLEIPSRSPWNVFWNNPEWETLKVYLFILGTWRVIRYEIDNNECRNSDICLLVKICSAESILLEGTFSWLKIQWLIILYECNAVSKAWFFLSNMFIMDNTCIFDMKEAHQHCFDLSFWLLHFFGLGIVTASMQILWSYWRPRTHHRWLFLFSKISGSSKNLIE